MLSWPVYVVVPIYIRDVFTLVIMHAFMASTVYVVAYRSGIAGRSQDINFLITIYLSCDFYILHYWHESSYNYNIGSKLYSS